MNINVLYLELVIPLRGICIVEINELDNTRMFLVAPVIIWGEKLCGKWGNGDSRTSISNEMVYSMGIYKKEGFFFLFIIDIISTLITLYEGMSIMYY